jgi:hypothetical protein
MFIIKDENASKMFRGSKTIYKSCQISVGEKALGAKQNIDRSFLNLTAYYGVVVTSQGHKIVVINDQHWMKGEFKCCLNF